MYLPIHSVHGAPRLAARSSRASPPISGFVPNLAAVAAGSPALLAGFDGMRRAVARMGLDPCPLVRTGVGVVVDNHYGIAFHSRCSPISGCDDRSRRDPIGRTRRPGSGRRCTLRRPSLTPRRGDDQTVSSAEAAGLSHDAILEVLLEVAFASLVGLVDSLAGHGTSTTSSGPGRSPDRGWCRSLASRAGTGARPVT